MNVNKIGRVKTQIHRVPRDKGESIEEMIRRCTESNEPIESTAPMIYTEEAAGVQPQYNIRADRFEIALDAVDKYQKSEIARQKAEKDKAAEAAKAEEGKKE